VFFLEKALVFVEEVGMDRFENIWNFLQINMKSGTVLKNWTSYSGYLGDSMTITKIGRNYIEFEAPKAKHIQHVPKEDFEKVWRVWTDYKTQKVKRYELRDMTRFSKYIISLLHWYEEESLNGEI